MRRKLLSWLFFKALKYPTHKVLPKWTIVLRLIFFPIETYYVEYYKGMKFNWRNFCYEINGISFDRDLFEYIKENYKQNKTFILKCSGSEFTQGVFLYSANMPICPYCKTEMYICLREYPWINFHSETKPQKHYGWQCDCKSGYLETKK